MTILEVLPRNDEGFIVLAGAAVIQRGGEEMRIDAYTTDEAVIALFGDLVESQVPITQEQYDALIDASSAMWKEQWQRWRGEGVI